MFQDIGITNSIGTGVLSPVPSAWLLKPTAPAIPPGWLLISGFSGEQMQALAAQLSYSNSQWDYGKIGSNNELGAYQFTASILEQYNLLLAGSVAAYGNQAVNRPNAWAGNANSTQFLSDARNSHKAPINNIQEFLANKKAQDNLAYRRIFDLYNQLVKTAAVKTTDTADIISGMIFVAWAIGAGNGATPTSQIGSGAWAWRYSNYSPVTSNLQSNIATVNSNLQSNITTVNYNYGSLAFNTGRYASTLANIGLNTV